MIKLRPMTTEEHNAPILREIIKKENELARPIRELLSTIDNKSFAQTKIDTINAEIQALRNTLKKG